MTHQILGLAAGTILYVVVFEVLQRERSKIVSGLVQLFFVVAGFSAMMCIDLFGKYTMIIDCRFLILSLLLILILNFTQLDTNMTMITTIMKRLYRQP